MRYGVPMAGGGQAGLRPGGYVAWRAGHGIGGGQHVFRRPHRLRSGHHRGGGGASPSIGYSVAEGTATMFGWLMTNEGIPQVLTARILDFSSNPIIILLLLTWSTW